MEPLKVGDCVAIVVLSVEHADTGWAYGEKLLYSTARVSPPLDMQLNKDSGMGDLNVVYLKGDWTGRDSSVVVVRQISKFLGDVWPVYEEVVDSPVGEGDLTNCSTDPSDQSDSPDQGSS